MMLLPEPLSSPGQGGSNPHFFGHGVDLDSADGTGGCPMMRHLNSIGSGGRDEL